MEFEIGTAKVTIEVEDENAKYPLALAIISDENLARESEASLQTFLRWMWNRIEDESTVDSSIKSIEKQLDQIKEIKQFTTDFKPITTTETQSPPAGNAGAQRKTPAARGGTSRITAPGASPPATPTTARVTTTVADQQLRQSADFTRIFHSSLIDLDLLARPTIESPTRKESALKYISPFAATKVNINSAPRQVLESVFVFGGDEKDIADQIILKRRIKPFDSIDELKKELFSFSDSIDRCKKFISTQSDLYTIKVTAISGAARCTVLIVVSRDGNQTKRIALIAS
jgi:hypothetical protein